MAGTIAVFPGQGTQAVGMGGSLFEADAAGRAVFEAVDGALGERLSTLIMEGPEAELVLTRNAQPALLACAIAAVRALEARTEAPLSTLIVAAAGHSLGEYSALVAVGALDLADAARLLRLRGEAMQDAVPAGEGAMAAVLGADVEAVEELAKDAAEEAGGVCEIGNDNVAGQAVLSGAKGAIETAVRLAKARGIKRVVILPVSAPFHCQLMAPAAGRLAEALAEVRIEKPARPVLSNVTADLEDEPETIRRLLVEQVCGRVRWRESMERMLAIGVDRMVEFGPGKVLTGLAKRPLKGIDLLNAQSLDEVEALAAVFAA